MWRYSMSMAQCQDLITGHTLLKLLCNFNFKLHKAKFTEGHKWTLHAANILQLKFSTKKLQKCYVQINISIIMPSLHTTHKSN